jgi:hypothetical protein
MRPPARATTNYEKVATGDFVKGVISGIEYDENHSFKGFEGKPDKIAPAIRFVFTLDGYEYPHRSRWMNFNMGEKANLYKKYVARLVENARPDMDFDLDLFLKMKVKTIWMDNGDFQNLDSIYPDGKKLNTSSATVSDEPAPYDEDDFPPEPDDDDVPM